MLSYILQNDQHRTPNGRDVSHSFQVNGERFHISHAFSHAFFPISKEKICGIHPVDMPSAYERISLTAMRSRTYCIGVFAFVRDFASFTTLVKLDKTAGTGLGKQREERKRERGALLSTIACAEGVSRA